MILWLYREIRVCSYNGLEQITILCLRTFSNVNESKKLQVYKGDTVMRQINTPDAMLHERT